MDDEDKIAHTISGLDLAQRARENNFPLGLSIFYVDKENWFIEEKPDGTIIRKKKMPDRISVDRLKYTL